MKISLKTQVHKVTYIDITLEKNSKFSKWKGSKDNYRLGDFLNEGIEPDSSDIEHCRCKEGRHIVAEDMFEAIEKRGCLPLRYNL